MTWQRWESHLIWISKNIYTCLVGLILISTGVRFTSDDSRITPEFGRLPSNKQSVYVHVRKSLEEFAFCVYKCGLPVRQLCDLQQGLVGRTALGCQGVGRSPLLLWPHHQLTPPLWAELHAAPGKKQERRVVNCNQYVCSLLSIVSTVNHRQVKSPREES